MLYFRPKMYEKDVSWLKPLRWLTNPIYKALTNVICSKAKEFRETQSMDACLGTAIFLYHRMIISSSWIKTRL